MRLRHLVSPVKGIFRRGRNVFLVWDLIFVKPEIVGFLNYLCLVIFARNGNPDKHGNVTSLQAINGLLMYAAWDFISECCGWKSIFDP